MQWNYNISKRLASFIVFSIVIVDPVFAEAPFLTTDPEILDPHTTATTLYASVDKAKTVTSILAPALEFDYGLAKNLQFDFYTDIVTYVNASPNYKSIFPNATGFNDVTLELKYRFIQENKNFPQVAFVPNVVIPTGNQTQGLGNGRMWYELPISIQKSFGDWKTYVAAGYARNPQKGCKNYLFGGWVLEKNLHDKAMLGAEIYTQQANSIYYKAYTLLNLGGSYAVSKNTNLVASVGHSINGQEHWAAYLGLVFDYPTF